MGLDLMKSSLYVNISSKKKKHLRGLKKAQNLKPTFPIQDIGHNLDLRKTGPSQAKL